MKLSNARSKSACETHVLGTVTITHSKGDDQVFFVAPTTTPGKVFEEKDASVPGTQYYVTELVSDIAFDDLSKGKELLTGLKGRDLSDITDHCVKNYR